VGIYGVMAYFVQQHRREIGIRVALGGGPARVWRHVVAQGMGIAIGGVALGLVAALLWSSLIGSLLYGVEATDAATFGGVLALLLGVALAACAGPARRAARLDPARTLREE
jgi:ABC-type antimicrobial peptide transport system permease subunit